MPGILPMKVIKVGSTAQSRIAIHSSIRFLRSAFVFIDNRPKSMLFGLLFDLFHQ